jgi:PAS domain S-box-containing protein
MLPFFKKVSLKTVLTLLFVFLVVISVGLTNYLAFRNGQEAVNEIAIRLRSEVTARIEQHLQTYLETPHLINAVNTNAILLKHLNIRNFSNLENQFQKQSQLFDSVSYIYFASEASGDFIGVKKEADDALTIRTGSGTDFRVYATDEHGNRDRLLARMPHIDPRIRPWYRAAMQEEQCIWSPIYVWVESPNISIDAVCPTYNAEGGLEGVLGVSLTLSDIHEFLGNLKIGSTGKTFIMERSGLLVSTSTSETGITVTDDSTERVKAPESPDPFIHQAAQSIMNYFDNSSTNSTPTLNSIDRIHYLEFEIEGERQFAQITPFHDERGLDWLIIVLIPESEFMAQIQTNTRNTILQCVFALLVAIGLGITTARWVTQPILRLNTAAKALTKGEWNQAVVVDRDDEVGQLAKSFTQMTDQLHASFAILEAKNAELSKTESALRASERQYRLLVENVADGIGIIQEGKLVFVNDALASLLGYTPDNLLEKVPVELFRSNDTPYFGKMREYIEHDLTNQQWQVLEFVVTKDGREVWIEGRHSAITWESRPAILITMRDITERKRKENEINEERRKLRQENIRLKSAMRERYRFSGIVGKSLAMQEVYELILKASATDAHVVICGESGTGKELIAQTIHKMSKRRREAFIPVNCGGIPETLFEREFFGHRKGTFTGALKDAPGFFDAAHDGTLFLDEIGELTPTMQVKLLRAIEGGGYTPVGSQTAKYVNVRIIAATNRDMIEQIKQGTMRSDFFYRINVITIKIPPLRKRREDIPLLAEHFLKQYSKRGKQQILPGKILEALYNYDWPGNVRQFQNVLQRYLTLKRLEIGDDMYEDGGLEGNSIQRKVREIGDLVLSQALEEFEKQYILNMLQQHNWHRKDTATALGITPRTLRRKIHRYEIGEFAQEQA